MAPRPEIVAYNSNAAVVFLVNFSLYLFLQPQRQAAEPRRLLGVALHRRVGRSDSALKNRLLVHGDILPQRDAVRRYSTIGP